MLGKKYIYINLLLEPQYAKHVPADIKLMSYIKSSHRNDSQHWIGVKCQINKITAVLFWGN